MGCDIHLRLDRRKVGSVEWYPEQWAMQGERDYRMFGALVRGHPRYEEDDAAPEERGWPADARWTDNVGGDHTASWVTREEFAAAIDRVEAEFRDGRTRMHEWRALLAYWVALEMDGSEVRLLFNFDS